MEMTRDEQREYLRRQAETGRLLEELRWRELANLAPEKALEASNMLIEAALRVPLPAARRTWSGLGDLQALLHRRKKT